MQFFSTAKLNLVSSPVNRIPSKNMLYPQVLMTYDYRPGFVCSKKH